MGIKNSHRGPMGFLLVALLLVCVFMFIFPGLSLGSDGSLGSFDDSGTHLRQEGSFFTVRISKGSPIRIFVAGREEGMLDPKLLKVTVRRLKPYLGQILAADSFGNYFSVSDKAELENATAVEVQAKMEGRSEIFHFDVKALSP
ncbi:MAG: hypothetical protein K2X47_09080 [Bdellovibrionales bacterium]|nr:hypothetical protein [Bdellovibrionales bacterium]